MSPGTRDAPGRGDAERDGIAAAALTVVRRAYVEGIPITRDVFAQEVSVVLDTPEREAMERVDLVAQRLGVSALS
jgi:hypothetical protein